MVGLELLSTFFVFGLIRIGSIWLARFLVYQRTCKHLGGLTTAGGHPVGTIVIFGLGSLSSCIVSI